jgi:outer membrane protein OmpA-like peptidoglycan-associated protein
MIVGVGTGSTEMPKITNLRMRRITYLKLATLAFVLLHCVVDGRSATKSSEKKAYVDEFIDPLRLVSLSVIDREEIADIARDKPTIDLDIPFGVDTAILTAEAKTRVEALGRAISNTDLAGSTFVIAGHTDGLESEIYSQS